MRFRLLLVLAGFGALFALAFALVPVDLRQAGGYVAGHPYEVALAALAYTGAFALRAVAWRPLIGLRIPFLRLFALLMGALFLNHAAPAKAGDLARMYALSRRGLPTERAVVSVVLSRIVDLAGLLAVLVAALSLAGAGGRREVLLAALAVVGAAALFAAARLEMPVAISDRFGSIARYAGRVRTALRTTRPESLLKSFAFAAPAWVLEAGILWVVARGLGLDLALAEVVAASCFAVLVSAVPLAPGSLGTYEAGMVAILVVFGVGAETAFAAAVLTHAIKFLYAFAAAPFALGEGLASVRRGKGIPDEASI